MKALKQLGAMLLALILLCGVAFGVGWAITGTYKVTEWFKIQPIEGEQGGNSNDGNNGGNNNSGNTGNGGNAGNQVDNVNAACNFLIEPDEQNGGVQLTRTYIAPESFEEYGISPQSESAYTVKATVKDLQGNAPDSIQYVKFELQESTARNYVKMTVTDNVTATFECLSPFSTYFNVKITSTQDTSKYTNVKLGYRPRIESFNLKWGTNSKNNLTNGSACGINFLSANDYNSGEKASTTGLEISNDVINWSIGTETPKLTKATITISPLGSFGGQLGLENITKTIDFLNPSSSDVSIKNGVAILSEFDIFTWFGLTPDQSVTYLKALDGNITHDFNVIIDFNGDKQISFFIAGIVPVIGGVGQVTTDKDTVIF